MWLKFTALQLYVKDTYNRLKSVRGSQTDNETDNIKYKKPLYLIRTAFVVFPKGFEPLSSEPESEILSIELREHLDGFKYNEILYLNYT